MEQRILTGTGITVSRACVGTMMFGARMDEKDSIDTVQYAYDAGINFFDTANVYAQGRSEEIVGKAIKPIRDKVILATKVGYEIFSNSHPNESGLSRRHIMKAVEDSLRRLDTDYIDIYYMHRPIFDTPIEETLDTFSTLVRSGKVRYIGMSNMTIPKLEAVLPCCRILPAAIEMELHPSFQQPELFGYVVQRGIAPIGYCPLGSPSRPERDRSEDDIADMDIPEIREIAARHGVHPALICLKWAVQHGQTPIPFSVKPAQYIGNLRAVTEDPLTDAEMESIRRADRGCRLVKGQVFLWPGANDWEDLWDVNGVITQ